MPLTTPAGVLSGPALDLWGATINGDTQDFIAPEVAADVVRVAAQLLEATPAELRLSALRGWAAELAAANPNRKPASAPVVVHEAA